MVTDPNVHPLEQARLHALRDQHVLDTAPEARFDRITAMAAAHFQVPIALVSLIDTDRQWFKSCIGLDVSETPRELAFCDHAIRMDEGSVFLVKDASVHPLFEHNPLVTGAPHIRFYAGAVLTTAQGFNLGTLCVIDTVARPDATEDDFEHLKALGRIVVDQLELGQTRHSLAERHRMLDMAQGLSGVGHWRYDRATGRADWSDEVYRIHGMDPSAGPPNYETLIQAYHEDDRPLLVDLIQKAVATGEGYGSQLRIRRPDGEVRYTTAKTECVCDEQGQVASLFGVFQDVTEQHLAQQALTEAKAEAERATAIKTEFLSNMSHELRTPLTSILGFSSLLDEEAGLSPVARRSVDRIAGSSQALLTIVNDILEFTRLEAGHVEIERRPADMRGLLEGTLSLFEPQAGQKALELRFVEDEPLPGVLMVDSERVRQVLLNLIGNAVKFTAEGVVTVKAGYDPVSERLRCEVVDTGPGIPADRLALLFRRFSQIDGSNTRRHGGTGLGLAISKGLVEAMGGEIGAVSGDGPGSTFWFELPCVRGAAGPVTSRKAGEVADLRGVRLLVVDDSAMNREIVALMLDPYGVQITDAASGQEAIDLSARMPFDLILMDIRMPDVDGPAATRAIRDGGGPNDMVPILAFTAESEDAGGKLGWAALFNDRVAKPVFAETLSAALGRWAPAASGTGIPA
jgi:PAS domain S-box-containing protein